MDDWLETRHYVKITHKISSEPEARIKPSQKLSHIIRRVILLSFLQATNEKSTAVALPKDLFVR